MIDPNPQSASRAIGHNPESVDGLLVIDKPEGWTSHDVVARVRKLMKTRRVGHTGTLDPFATGALVLCLNRATRLVQFLTGDDKEYIATMRLGFGTDTGDLTGTPNTPVTDAGKITSEMLREAFGRFRGRIKQIPPMYSAKKIGGVKLYEMARRGEEIERAPIEVNIKELELCDHPEVGAQGEAQAGSASEPGEFSFRVVCSSGTYIRTLAEDVGGLLGVGAHLIRLRRTRAGNCSLSAAVTLDQLADMAHSGRTEMAMISMADAVLMPVVQVDQEDRKRISHGRSIENPRETHYRDKIDGELVKICDKKNQLIAIAEYDSSKSLWRPRVVLMD